MTRLTEYICQNGCKWGISAKSRASRLGGFPGLGLTGVGALGKGVLNFSRLILQPLLVKVAVVVWARRSPDIEKKIAFLCRSQGTNTVVYSMALALTTRQDNFR
ncbi:hypothetical protein WKK05_13870 [Nostoc sp. UHCC 0302]|uniref:hypothetical protein n=1 Tax=Nostoc sp. UHCC 0302 TaxID=3134896 RepID=UPI00311CDBBF